MTLEEFYKIREKEGDLIEYNYKGYDIQIVRHPSVLNLRAYINIPKDSEFYLEDAHYNDFYKTLPLSDQEWTYGGYDGKGNYVLGFECSHVGQYCPGYDELNKQMGLPSSEDGDDIYWTVEMCKNQMEEMIDNCLTPIEELQKQRIKDLEYSYQDKNGKTKYRTVTLYLEIDENGDVVGVNF